MFWLDTTILAVLCLGAILGARTGLVWQLARVVGIGGSIYLAVAINGPVSDLMRDVFLLGADARLAQLLAYIVVFVGSYLIIYFLTCLIYEGIEATPLEPFDRLLGAALGLVKTAAVLAVVCWSLVALQNPRTQQFAEKSMLVPALADGMEAALMLIPASVKQDLCDGLQNLRDLARPKG
jgi:membrane protein required for colicin V production